VSSQEPLPEAPPLRDDLPVDMTDLELFKRFCMPLGDLWEDASWPQGVGGSQYHVPSIIECKVAIELGLAFYMDYPNHCFWVVNFGCAS